MTPPAFSFDDLSLDELRRRQSAKWQRYPADVLPVWVAEMDFPLPRPVHAVLEDAVARDDTGYAYPEALAEAFALFAAARFGWTLNPKRTLVVAVIMSGIAEVLLALTAGRERGVVH